MIMKLFLEKCLFVPRTNKSFVRLPQAQMIPALTPNLRFFFTEIMIGAIMNAHAPFPALGEQASRRASEQANKV